MLFSHWIIISTEQIHPLPTTNTLLIECISISGAVFTVYVYYLYLLKYRWVKNLDHSVAMNGNGSYLKRAGANWFSVTNHWFFFMLILCMWIYMEIYKSKGNTWIKHITAMSYYHHYNDENSYYISITLLWNLHKWTSHFFKNQLHQTTFMPDVLQNVNAKTTTFKGIL